MIRLRPLIFIFAAGFFGSSGSFSLYNKAYKEQQAGRFEKCAQLYREAAAAGLKDASKSKPDKEKHAVGLRWAAASMAEQAVCLKELGRAEEMKPILAQCVDTATQAIQKLEILIQRPMDGEKHAHMAGNLGASYGSRARCRKEQGQLAEALSDKEIEIKHLNESCHRTWPPGTKGLGKKFCGLVVDNIEMQAKWKKEVGIKDEAKAPVEDTKGGGGK